MQTILNTITLLYYCLQQSECMLPHTQINIGLQIASLSDSYNNELIDSINIIATKLNVNLIVFLGGHPNQPKFKHLHHQTVIYEHINSDNLDAIIILSGTLSHFKTKAEFQSTLDKLNSIPIISIGVDISEFINNQSSIIVNSASGLSKLIEHLIADLKYKNIAFITGPLDNPEALMRFKTYKQTLTKHNIELNQNNIYYGRFIGEDAIPAINQFLANKQIPQVIVCSNDVCALAVIEELSNRNIRVPQDIAVTGFDNVLGTQTSSPPLTTVSQSFIQIGYVAVQVAIRHALKQPYKKTYQLETVFIERQSCGSLSYKKYWSNDELDAMILAPLNNISASKTKATTELSIYELLMKVLESIFKHSKYNINVSMVAFEEHFLVVLKKRIHFDIRLKSGFSQWMQAVEQLENENIGKSNKIQSINLISIKIRDCLIKEQMLVRDSDLATRDNVFFIKDIVEEISDSKNFNELSQKIRARYKQLINYISLGNYLILGYPDPAKNYRGVPWISPKKIDVMLSFNNIDNKKIQKRARYDSKILFPKELIPNTKRYTLVVQALYCGDDQLGRVIHELYPREIDLFTCTMITTQIASTIQIIHQNNARVIAKKKFDVLLSDLEIKKQLAEEAVIAKGRFLATMSHEIRTPMNGVLGLTELLKDTNLNTEQNKYLDAIQSSSNSLLNIISDILDFSKIEEGKIALENIEFNLNSICKEVISIFSFNDNKKNIDLIIDIHKKLPTFIKSDPTRLRQILINLIGNAFKFTEKGSITLKIEPYSNSYLKLNKNEVLIKFLIIDTGLGISEENTEKLFGAFNQADSSTTRKFGGTGLGLSISKSLVELMGGNMGFTSKTNIGSTFWFTIVSRTSLQTSSQISKKTNINHLNQFTIDDPNKFRGKEILVAEDNKVNQMVINGMIKKLGANCTIVENGKEALETYQNSIINSSSKNYNLIIMDFEMPVLDGGRATKLIRSFENNLNKPHSKSSPNHHAIHIPIIAITAHAMSEHRSLCIASGMDDYLSKPIDSERLSQIFHQYLIDE